MAIVALDSRLAGLVDLNAEVEKIATGFVFTEGPVWHARERHLTFSDVFGGVMYRWTESGGAAVFRKPSDGANGNTYDRQGRLVTCQHDHRVTRTNPDGSVEELATNYQGKHLNAPNDIVCAASGDLIFTDPFFALPGPDGSVPTRELDFQGVYRVSARDSSLTLLNRELEAPNGVVIDERRSRLYVDDTRQSNVHAWDIAADGSLTNHRIFCEVKHGDARGSPDGMKLDSQGNLYVAANSPEGVWVFASDGALLGFIGVGEEKHPFRDGLGGPANLAWGGDDWRTLYVTAVSSVYRLRMKVAGQPVYVP